MCIHGRLPCGSTPCRVALGSHLKLTYATSTMLALATGSIAVVCLPSSVLCSHLNLPGFGPIALLGSESGQLTWQSQGLPSDTLSAQNALAILHTVQTPLVIDPSYQAVEWLKANLKASGQTIDVLPQHDAHFNNSLELAVRFGKVLVVSEVDRVHPILYPLLRSDVEKLGGRLVVPVGDKLVDHNPSFKLYLVTRNASPALTPDVTALLTVTNFSITPSGLESQLLSVALQHEQPELESRKAQLLHKEAGLTLQLAALEKQLLQALATSRLDSQLP
eukprot:GHUV01053137.1.p1 GENE.GHUV01053137.1~~GHUV01053137.1.p1  ORF type:complete len:277 (+),score=77.41 GHUV01053137.1:557-1387(+)